MDAKAKFGIMMAAGMAMAVSTPQKRWGGIREDAGKRTARPDKKAKRKMKQASRRKNRKK